MSEAAKADALGMGTWSGCRDSKGKSREIVIVGLIVIIITTIRYIAIYIEIIVAIVSIVINHCSYNIL